MFLPDIWKVARVSITSKKLYIYIYIYNSHACVVEIVVIYRHQFVDKDNKLKPTINFIMCGYIRIE